MFFKMVILVTVHSTVLWGTKNGSSMASLQKHPFDTFHFKSVVEKWLFYHVATLLKIKVSKGVFAVKPQKNHFCFPKEPFSEQFLKEPFFLSMKNNLNNLKNVLCIDKVAWILKVVHGI